MTDPIILGQLSNLQAMMRQLVRGVPHEDANVCFVAGVGSLAWCLGRAVFRETFWLREVLSGDTDVTDRVRDLFTPAAMELEAQCASLPPTDHLLNWAHEIQDEHLRRLATPGELPRHALLEDDRLPWYLLQETAGDYETMLMVLLARSLEASGIRHRVGQLLEPRPPEPALSDLIQGHYRVGSRGEPFAYDNELPPQAVELSSFRIARRPVTNAEYLAFMQARGYEDRGLWSEAGRHWRDTSGTAAPLHWRRDSAGRWYGIGLNGPGDLQPEEPISGISQHEATAFANWAAHLGGELSGAVLPHEYQWEVAARGGLIEGIGRVWEWCSNTLHPYPKFTPFPDNAGSAAWFGSNQVSLRGASLHTQRCLRRASFRNWAAREARHRFAGMRLVLPPKQ